MPALQGPLPSCRGAGKLHLCLRMPFTRPAFGCNINLPTHLHRRRCQIAASTQVESVWTQFFQDVLGRTGSDPGHWNFSPEWWGTQDDGWGRTSGDVVFAANSDYNGRVQVTSHPASQVGGSSSAAAFAARGDEEEFREEWRVLRFNDVTRQSVARVHISQGKAGAGLQIAAYPDCLAPEYLKSIAAVFAAIIGLSGLLLPPDTNNTQQAQQELRVLCIGLGGGSLPLFIAHHYPWAIVDAVEIDPIVVKAAVENMGLPTNIPSLNVITDDAFNFLQRRVSSTHSSEAGNAAENSNTAASLYDIICVDAFDGNDDIPSCFSSQEFAQLAAAALHPRHGCLLMNFHEAVAETTAATFCDALGIAASSTSSSGSSCFTVSTQKQMNVTLACTRGAALPAESEAAKEMLRLAAAFVADQVGYMFPAGRRASWEFLRLR